MIEKSCLMKYFIIYMLGKVQNNVKSYVLVIIFLMKIFVYKKVRVYIAKAKIRIAEATV